MSITVNQPQQSQWKAAQWESRRKSNLLQKSLPQAAHRDFTSLSPFPGNVSYSGLRDLFNHSYG